MATEAAAAAASSDHTPPTDEQFVKKEKDEAITQMIASLANEDEDKHDKPEDAQDQAIPSSKTGGETKGDEEEVELEDAKSNGSPAFEATAEDNVKHNKVEDAQTPSALSTKPDEAKGDDNKAEPDDFVEKTNDSVALEANVADNSKEETELIPDSQNTSVTVKEPANEAAEFQPEGLPSTESTAEETPQQLEKESVTEASAETIEQRSNTVDAIPLEEPEAEVVKETGISEPSAEKEENPEPGPKPEPEPEPEATQVQVKTEDPENEFLEKPQEAEQPSTVTIPESSAEVNKKPSDFIEEKIRELSEEVLKDNTNNEAAGPTESEKVEPVITEVEENPKEPEVITEAEENPKQLQVITEVEEITKEPEVDIEVEENTKELIPDSQNTSVTVAESAHDAAEFQPEESPSTGSTVKETPQLLEKESIPEASAETNEKPSDTVEANPLTESEAEAVKETEILEPSAAKEENPEPEPEPEATQVQVKAEEPENESEEKPQEAEQPSTVTTTESSAEVNEKPSDFIEEKTRELSEEMLKDKINNEAEKVEPVITEADEKSKESEVVTEAEENPKESEVITGVVENPKEPEKQPTEPKEEQQPNAAAIPEPSAETIDATEEKTREPDIAVEALKESNNYEAVPTEAEKAEPVVTEVDESPSEPEKQSSKQQEKEKPETVIPETVAENAEKPGNSVEVHTAKESDIEVVKESLNSESEAVPEKAEEPEPVSTEVEEKPREQLEVSEDVGETDNGVETKQEIVLDSTKFEGDLDDTIKDPIKEEKTERDEETSITANTVQVSSIREAQAATENPVEPSPEVAEKVVEEDDGKNETSFTDVNEDAPNEVDGGVKVAEQASTGKEAKTGLVEEREYSAPASVEEKVEVAANDDKKDPEAAPDAVSKDAEVEIKKLDEQSEAKTETEAGDVKVECVKDNAPAVDDKEEVKADTKVDEISTAARETVRETLASKFEEQEAESTKAEPDNSEKEQVEEPAKTEVEDAKESDATKTANRDLPKEAPAAKPAQKQSNNIISKVKQSLVKAKKAIIGKSPSSKNHSSDAKGDIQVK